MYIYIYFSLWRDDKLRVDTRYFVRFSKMDLFLFPARGRTRVKSYYFFVVINVRGEEYNRRSFATSFKVDCYAYVDINSSKKKGEIQRERI